MTIFYLNNISDNKLYRNIVVTINLPKIIIIHTVLGCNTILKCHAISFAGNPYNNRITILMQ